MRSTSVWVTFGDSVRWKSSDFSVCTMAGTLSRSMPAPGSGVVEITWISGSATFWAAAGPDTRMAPAAVDTANPRRRRA
jgi:hypothetical protein